MPRPQNFVSAFVNIDVCPPPVFGKMFTKSTDKNRVGPPPPPPNDLIKWQLRRGWHNYIDHCAGKVSCIQLVTPRGSFLLFVVRHVEWFETSVKIHISNGVTFIHLGSVHIWRQQDFGKFDPCQQLSALSDPPDDVSIWQTPSHFKVTRERSHMTSARFWQILPSPCQHWATPWWRQHLPDPPFQSDISFSMNPLHSILIETLNVYLIQLQTERCHRFRGVF